MTANGWLWLEMPGHDLNDQTGYVQEEKWLELLNGLNAWKWLEGQTWLEWLNMAEYDYKFLE